MKETFYATDALGNDIVIGCRYGYSKSSNGVTNVVTGEALKLHSNNKVQLGNIIDKSYLWIGEGRDDHSIDEPTRKRTVSSIQLFKVS